MLIPSSVHEDHQLLPFGTLELSYQVFNRVSNCLAITDRSWCEENLILMAVLLVFRLWAYSLFVSTRTPSETFIARTTSLKRLNPLNLSNVSLYPTSIEITQPGCYLYRHKPRVTWVLIQEDTPLRLTNDYSIGSKNVRSAPKFSIATTSSPRSRVRIGPAVFLRVISCSTNGNLMDNTRLTGGSGKNR